MCDVGQGMTSFWFEFSGIKRYWKTEGFVEVLYYVVFGVLINELELHNPGFICSTKLNLCAICAYTSNTSSESLLYLLCIHICECSWICICGLSWI